MAREAGEKIAGKYELVRRLGRGAMAEVWVARDPKGADVAVKLLELRGSIEREGPETASARFNNEIAIAKGLSEKSKHVVGVIDHGEDDAQPYLVMELVEGDSLAQLLKRETRLSPALTVAVVAQIAEGVAAAHDEGVFHRDLKPANVLLARDEEGRLVAKILDFGVAKLLKGTSPVAKDIRRVQTGFGVALGTPAYMSPEQARGKEPIDTRCDLWSLSVIAYQALGGALPYEGKNNAELLANIAGSDPAPIRERAPDVSPAFDSFFVRAFAPDIEDRFPDVHALVSAFISAAKLAGVEIDANPVIGAPHAKKEATAIEEPAAEIVKAEVAEKKPSERPPPPPPVEREETTKVEKGSKRPPKPAPIEEAPKAKAQPKPRAVEAPSNAPTSRAFIYLVAVIVVVVVLLLVNRR